MIDLKQLLQHIQRKDSMDRRTLFTYAAALAATPLIGDRAAAQEAATPRPRFDADPFSAGVASGDPSDTSVVLWTRLAPVPLEPGGGMRPENVAVRWEIAGDDAMRQVIRQGDAVATPQLGHTVHIEVDGLQPNRWYWYRFRAGDAVSPIGRTRTTPEPNSTPDRLRFAFASCQHLEAGHFTAYEHMAREELDLVFHLGDYIYEGRGLPMRVRRHQGAEIQTLDDYRIRHAQYKSDRLLQAMHARCPWLVTWDDHELDNNYAAEISEEAHVNPANFLARRANAYQAYYEMMPLRRRSLPRGANMQLYRKVAFGRLAEFFVLDTRQYRSNQPNNDRASEINEWTWDPAATMLGARQYDWLMSSLLQSHGSWNVLAQQVMMGIVDRAAGDPERYSMDQWPGYMHERNRLMRFIDERRVPNPVVLTGDIHSNWANDIRIDDREFDRPIVAAEFVGTSISSGGNGVPAPATLPTLLSENPFVRFHNTQRGYVSCTVTPGNWRSDFRVVENVVTPGAPLVTRASFVVEAGRRGIQTA